MSKKVQKILSGVLCLVMAVVLFFAMEDRKFLLFRVIPLSNVETGIIFALLGVICLFCAFADKDNKDMNK